jgi:hypothetical protein
MHSAHQHTAFTIGQRLAGKWIGIKVVCKLVNGGKDRYIAEYIDFPILDINQPPNSWRKYFEVTDTGQLEAGHIVKPIGSRTTCRIDGVWKNGQVKKSPQISDVDPPEFRFASVREIVGQ